MSTGYEYRISVLVTSDTRSPDEMTTVIGVEPTQVWPKGERLAGGKGRPTTAHIWTWRAGRSGDMAGQMKMIEDMLAAHLNGFERVMIDSHVELQCVAEFGEDVPHFYLPDALVRMLGRIGASIDTDLYDFREAPPAGERD